jgi:hypothetical protein
MACTGTATCGASGSDTRVAGRLRHPTLGAVNNLERILLAVDDLGCCELLG